MLYFQSHVDLRFKIMSPLSVRPPVLKQRNFDIWLIVLFVSSHRLSGSNQLLIFYFYRCCGVYYIVSHTATIDTVFVTHYNDVIMSIMASQITSLTIVYSTVSFRRRSKKTSKPRVTGLCVGNSPLTGEFPAQKASNAEYVSIWWRHHVNFVSLRTSKPMMFMITAIFKSNIRRCIHRWTFQHTEAAIRRRYFQMDFLEWKYMNFA